MAQQQSLYTFSNGQSTDLGRVQVLGIAGSLREGSYNRALLRAAQDLAPEQMDIDQFDLSLIPFFNQDVEDEGDPAPVTAMKEAIADADAVLIASPEYQYGIPGVLKNAIDWASRPPGESALKNKPVATMGASPGFAGTARAQLQLRQALAYNEARILLRPEVLVADARERFDEDLNLVHEGSRTFLRKLLARLYNWTHIQKGNLEPGETGLLAVTDEQAAG